MPRKDFYALLTRLFLGYIFLSSGLCKLTGGKFGQLIGPPDLINDLAPYGLRDFAIFIAFSQVMTGALILSQRYSLLGLVMLMPVNISILAVTISQRWQGTPYVDAVFVLLNVLVLLYEWNTLKVFILPEGERENQPPRTNQLFPNQWLPVATIGLALIATVTARYNAPLTVIPATIGFLLIYGNILTNSLLAVLDKAVLALSLLAILFVTWADKLLAIHFNPMFAFLVVICLIGLLLVVSMVQNWWGRKRLANP
ncbi:DoxX family membrane protein [Tellurirhabdus bombi]|uniref:DoxX family membrane protein n=1 Tax=Tellurirhabdus bombi TaxID=2907205 RepID=UPI001F31F160|nr:DoxX family membrane protein [Tellurirhabdus bombi]